MAAAAVAVSVTATGAVYATACTLRGASIRDTSGAANTIRIYDNPAAASGTILLSVQLAANQAIPPLSITDGLRATAGLWLTATGTVEGSVWVG